MTTLRRILFPTDFSQSSLAARDLACSLAEQGGAELHLLHVTFEPAYLFPDPQSLTLSPISWDDLELAAEDSLAEVLDPRVEDRLHVVRAIRRGPPSYEILRYAQQHEIDLIVMSTHGRTGLPHLLLGSVAENVVRKAKCPVLTVHPADRCSPTKVCEREKRANNCDYSCRVPLCAQR